MVQNPFSYGGVVDSDDFCNRRQELADLRRAIDNRERLFLFSERRMGKSSLVKVLLSRLPKRAYVGIYIDLWPTDGVVSFVRRFAEALTLSSSPRTKILDTAKQLFSSLSPSLTLDGTGHPTIRFGPYAHAPEQFDLGEVLDAPARLAAERDAQIVVVLDEFQRLLEFEDDSVERALRSAVQNHHNVAYLFLGSRKHLIESMFVDVRRPLYRSAGHYPLSEIDAQHWIPFVRRRFQQGGKSISESMVRALCEITDGHPFYTQHLAHALWELTPYGAEVDSGMLERSVSLLLRREEYAFTTMWESLTRNQQRLLKGLTLEQKSPSIYSAEFIQRYELGTPSSSQRASASLLQRGITDRDHGSVSIVDRFFRLWIKRMFGASS